MSQYLDGGHYTDSISGGIVVDAAKLCREAGFDAVEIHMGHGYLLNQFISPLSNKRRDEFGGCAEDRARFPAEVLRRVKEAVGREMAVLAKINVADGVPGGATADDAIVTARMLQQAGADLLVLSELFVAGYPPEDLVLKPAFQAACRAEV